MGVRTAFALIVTVLLFLSGAFVMGGTYAAAKAEARFQAHLAEDRRLQDEATRAARETEQEMARLQNDVSAAYQRGRNDAEQEYQRVVADLRTGSLRLRDQWQGCVSDAAAHRSRLDAIARDREESAARIVRAAREADEHIRALQALLVKEREALNKQ